MTRMKITDNTPELSFEAAVWMFGGYPQVPYKDAVKRLMLKVKYIAGRDEISPTALWLLGRKTFGKDYKLI